MKNCSNCRDFAAGTCGNPKSVANGREVAATDSCAAFNPIPANDDDGSLGKSA